MLASFKAHKITISISDLRSNIYIFKIDTAFGIFHIVRGMIILITYLWYAFINIMSIPVYLVHVLYK